MTDGKINKLLIANRGEIAVRVIHSAREMGVKTVAVHSVADREALHVELADEKVCIGPAPATESYLVAANILEAAKQTGADAVHPGYGFLSENADFAEACGNEGIIFVGPPPAAIRAMGLKDEAKRIMEAAGVPVVPGYHGEAQDAETLAAEAEKIAYPVLIKAVAGGGGKGMRKVDVPGDFAEALAGAQREAKASFGDDRVLVEKFVSRPRHIEIQVFADGAGNAVHLFERDCSLQRRHQKVVEEAPAPGMVPELRAAMGKAAVEAAKAIGYVGAGTVEFIVDGSAPLSTDTHFYFMEMNTRLQVEHPVTEMIAGVDLVEWQLRVAGGEALPMAQDDLAINGHAVETRIYAENPAAGFLPQTGKLLLFQPGGGDGIRVDTGVRTGDEISIHYDPMIAKLIAWGPTRGEAIERLVAALRDTHIAGLVTNQTFLIAALSHGDFAAGRFDTGFIDQHLDELISTDESADGIDGIIAALAVSWHRQNSLPAPDPDHGDIASPFRRAGGWRLNLEPREPVRLERNGEFGDFEISAGTVRSAGAEFATDVAIAEDGTVTGAIDGEPVAGRVLATIDDVHVMREGRTRVFARAGAGHMDEGDAEGPGAVTAPMPGRILEVMVAVGEKVTKDQPLVLMEAMKMEYTLRAPRDGTVARVSAKKDEQVAEGQTLVTIEEE